MIDDVGSRIDELLLGDGACDNSYALGQEIKDAKVSWSASTANSILETTGVFTVPGTAGKVTITATYKDTTRGVEVKATLDVNVKDTAK